MADWLEDENEQRLADAVEDYSRRLPSPPRIFVPPSAEPTWLDYGIPGVTYQTEMQHFGNWEYAKRYTAQPILPWLYLGPASVARNADFLTQARISFVIVVRQQLAGSNSGNSLNSGSNARTASVRIPQELGIHTILVGIENTQALANQYAPLNEALRTHFGYQDTIRDPERRALVVCDTGNNKSAAVVITYLMATYNLPLVVAVQMIQAKRFSATMDDELKTSLEAFKTYVDARRSVEHGSGPGRGPMAGVVAAAAGAGTGTGLYGQRTGTSQDLVTNADSAAQRRSSKRGREEGEGQVDQGMDSDGTATDDAAHRGRSPFVSDS